MPYEENNDPVGIANKKNYELNNETSKNYSQATKSNISTPEEDIKKEEKAKKIIDEIVTDKIKPLEDQLKLLPGIIKNTVVEVLTTMQNQQNQEAQPVQSPVTPATPAANNNMEALGALAPLIAKFMGGDNPAPNNQMQDMIMNAFAKMIQAKVDETIMGTYNIQMRPPANVLDRTNTGVKVE